MNTSKDTRKFILLSVLNAILFSLPHPFLKAQAYTRGIGVYPGNPSEDFSPLLAEADTTYHNIALNRTAYHSSSYDYCLTAQLVTDGIIDTIVPSWVSVSSSQQGVIPKNKRQYIFDRNRMTNIPLEGPSGWIQIAVYGESKAVQTDSFTISGSVLVDEKTPLGWECRISGSDDGESWKVIGTLKGNGYPGDSIPRQWRRWAPPNMRLITFSLVPETTVGCTSYRAEFKADNVTRWNIAELELYNEGIRRNIGGPYDFTSAWMSAGSKEEWITIDLGTLCSFDHIVLHWIRRASVGDIQLSDNGTEWRYLTALPEGIDKTDDIDLAQTQKGRYIKVRMNQPASPEGYILSEIEVLGRGGFIVKPKPVQAWNEGDRLKLSGGNWKLRRASLVDEKGEVLSQSRYNDNNWLIATVPATILVSYLNAGALPDPNYGDNQLMISESYFYSDFWYRNTFTFPASYSRERVYLNFDGINWKAEVFLNGKKLGNIAGAFTRGRFDVTDLFISGGENVLTVRIEKNASPGYLKEQTKYSPDVNGGELGGDNPTFHASVGWDWIPTIRGRNTGIWNDVYLTTSGPVTIENPFIYSDLPLPDTSYADITVEVLLQNHSPEKVTGILQAKIGIVTFEHAVELNASSSQVIKLNPATNQELRINNPELWWPNGYGVQYLYDVELKFITADQQVSDVKNLKTGIREMTYSTEGGALKIWVNGKRFIGRGGNWGFPESMLRYRGREYETAVRYHKDMNFTMIRNWVGQTGDDEFFEACDRNGIMVWQDFWLANPADGPDPYDNELFMQNAEDFILRIRNHPSIALYCGRNEGYPPEILDTALRNAVSDFHSGLTYISNSSWDVVSGGGPYWAMPENFYFKERATPKLHSEMGRPAIVNYESLRQMMPDSAEWPQGRMWGLHDFCLNGAQRAASFIQQMEKSFGPIGTKEEWVQLAQYINYNGYRAMFEAQGKNRMGLLLWMSHPAWPSMVWQTYDYYFEPTAAYFGCKKASEPLHIQWNALTDSIEVVNYSKPDGDGLNAVFEIRNIDGTIQLTRSIKVISHEDSRICCFNMEYPETLSEVYFIRLRLTQGDKIVSENMYIRGREEGNLKAIRELPAIQLKTSTQVKQQENKWLLTTTLTNPDKYPAVMVRLKVLGDKNQERILPVLYSDNYITLMPGEEKIVYMELENADTRGETPVVVVEGINVK